MFDSDVDEEEDIKSNGSKQPADMNYYGIYKAVLVGLVGFGPFEKILGDGRGLTLFSVGTSGLIRPKNYHEQLQWHKVTVYPEHLRKVAKQLQKGRRVYIEGNLEMRIFNDNVTGGLKRIREVAVRRDGQLILLKGKETHKLTISGYVKPAVSNSPLEACQEEEVIVDEKILPYIP